LDNHTQLHDLLEDLNQAIKIESTFSIKTHILYAQGIGLMSKNLTTEGSNILRSATTLEPDTQDIFASIDFLLRGYIHILFDNYYLALEDFKKAIEINNTNASALAASGLIRQEKIGDYQGSIKELTKAIEINPKHNKSDLTFYSRAQSYYSLNEMDNAINDFTTALVINPNRVIIYFFRAMAHIAQGNFVQAEEDINLGMEIDPSLYTQVYQSAFSEFDKICQQPEVYDSLIQILMVIGNLSSEIRDFKSAEAIYTHALEISSGNTEIYAKRSSVRTQLEDFNGAIEDLQQSEQKYDDKLPKLEFLNWLKTMAYIFREIDKISQWFPEFATTGESLREMFIQGIIAGTKK
jgi:tetratricopeptide (TPR) repeat protein